MYWPVLRNNHSHFFRIVYTIILFVVCVCLFTHLNLYTTLASLQDFKILDSKGYEYDCMWVRLIVAFPVIRRTWNVDLKKSYRIFLFQEANMSCSIIRNVVGTCRKFSTSSNLRAQQVNHQTLQVGWTRITYDRLFNSNVYNEMMKTTYVRFKLVMHQYPGGEGRGLSLFFSNFLIITRLGVWFESEHGREVRWS